MTCIKRDKFVFLERFLLQNYGKYAIIPTTFCVFQSGAFVCERWKMQPIWKVWKGEKIFFRMTHKKLTHSAKYISFKEEKK